METRCGSEKSSVFSGLMPTATMSWSKSRTPRRMTSRCPLVMGSNWPGKTATRGDGRGMRGS